MPKLEIVAAKAIRGHDGQGFNATLAIDGAKACYVDDDGYGGGFTYTWLSKDEAINKANEAKLDEEVKEAFLKDPDTVKEKRKPDINNLCMHRDIVVEDLVGDFMELKRLKTLCSKKTAAVLPKCKPGQYVTWPVKFSPEIKTKLEKAEPGAVFLNEHLEDGKWKELLKGKA